MKITAILFAAAATTAHALDENNFAAACDGLSVGDDCLFSMPDGSTQYGTCFAPASPSACGPDYIDSSAKCVMCGENDGDASAGGGDTDSGMKENASTAACDDKDEGDSCAFTSPDGTKNTGVCTDEGVGACGPDADTSVPCYVCNTDPAPPSADDGSGGATNDNECTGLSVGDTCEIDRNDSTIYGVCAETEEDMDTSDGKLACEPVSDDKGVTDFPGGGDDSGDPEISNVLYDACSSKSEGSTCTYTDAASGKSVSGTCEDDGSGALQCDNESSDSDSSSDPLVTACAGKSTGDSCSVTYDIAVISGVCASSEAGDSVYCDPAGAVGTSRYLRSTN